jgi:hypothetical protein
MLPLEIVHDILKTACEVELFDQAKNDPLTFSYLERTKSPISPHRRLKLASYVASRVCRSWRKLVQTSPTFWVSSHPPITPDTCTFSSEKDCDLDLHQAYPFCTHWARAHNQPQMNTLEQFEKYLFPLLPRVRVLVLVMRNSTIAEAVMNHLAQAHLPRLRVAYLSCTSVSWIPRIGINAPWLYHLNLNRLGSLSGITRDQTKGLLSLGCRFSGFTEDHRLVTNMNLLASHLRTSSMTLTLLRMSLDGLDPPTTNPKMDVILMPCLVEVYFSCSIPWILQCMELFKMPNLHTFRVDFAPRTYPGQEIDRLAVLKEKMASDSGKVCRFDIPFLRELSISARAEVFPYLFALLSDSDDLSRVEKVSLDICSYRVGPSQLELIPLKDRVRFPHLRELALWIKTSTKPNNQKLDQVNWCLRFFDFSSVIERVSIVCDERDWKNEIPLYFPHLKTLHVEGIRDLSRVIIPSIRHIELTNTMIHPTELEYIEALPSWIAHSQVESLHIKKAVNLTNIFTDGNVYGLIPGIQTLILDLDLKFHHSEDSFLIPPVSIFHRFPKLKTLRLMVHSPKKHVSEVKLRRIVNEIASFNRPRQQTVRRIELHGWKSFLDDAEPAIRESLPPMVEFCSIEMVPPIVTRKFGWN